MKLFVILAVALILPLLIITIGNAFAANEIHFHGGVNPSTDSVHKGETVEFYGWANSYRDWGSGYTEVPNSTFDIKIVDPNNKTVFKQTLTGDEKSNIHFSLTIENDFEFGTYHIVYSIFAQGYEIFSEDYRYFYVIRTLKDIETAKDYELNLWTNQTNANYQSYAPFFAKFCIENPPTLDSGFYDPESGESIDQPRFLHLVFLTKPDGTKVSYGGGFADLECGKTLENSLYGELAGDWTIQYGVKWSSKGILYSAKSNPITIHVSEPKFPATITKIINMTNNSQGLDISQDNKFIIFTTSANDESENPIELLWTSNVDGTNVKKIETGKKFLQFGTPKISPSGNLILWYGGYYVSSNAAYGLFVYDLKENKLVQIPNVNEDPNTMGEFHWIKDNTIAFVSIKWDNISHTLATSLVIDDSKGILIKTIQTTDFSSIDLYKDPDSTGKITVSAQSFPYSGGGAVWIKSRDGIEEKIFVEPTGSNFPTSAAISSDSKTILFGYFGEGIYLAKLSKSALEYKSSSDCQTPIEKIENPPVSDTTIKSKQNVLFGEPKNISRTGIAIEPSFSVKGNDVYAVWSDGSSGNYDILFSRSTDGGATFSDAVNVSNNPGRSFEPQIIVGENNVFVLWTDETRISDPSANQNVFFAKSTDGGISFSKPLNLSKENVYSEATANYSPRLANSGNEIYVIWLTANYGWQNVFFTKSTDGGSTFDKPRNISNTDLIAQIPVILATKDDVYVGWNIYDSLSYWHDTISFVKSSDSGKTFSKLDIAKDVPTMIPQLFSQNDTVFAIFRQYSVNGTMFPYQIKSVDGSFSTEMQVGQAGNFDMISDKGKIYGTALDSSDGTYNVIFVKSKNNGQDFEVSTIFDPAWYFRSVYEEIPVPKLAKSGNGVYVVWRYNVSQDGKFVPFFASSKDDGLSFSEPVSLGNTDGDTIHPQIATSGNSIYIFWTDQIPSGSDIFMIKGTDPFIQVSDSENKISPAAPWDSVLNADEKAGSGSSLLVSNPNDTLQLVILITAIVGITIVIIFDKSRKKATQ